MIRLAVGLPAYDARVDVEHCNMWLALGGALLSNEDTFKFAGMTSIAMNPVADARNYLVEGALHSADWLLMVDADTYCSGEEAGVQILQMVKDAHAEGAALVGAPVRARGWTKHEPTVWMQDDVPRILSPAQKPAEPTMSIAPEESYRGKLVPCSRIGAAFTALNLGWLRDHMPDPPWYTHEPSMMGSRLNRLRAHGEDGVFCDMVRIRGGVILVDGRITPSHVMMPARL